MYATSEDLLARLPAGTEPPADADGLLRHAAALVQWYTSGAVYTTTRDGLPYDARLRRVFADATLTQAAFWAANGLDPAVGALAEEQAAVVSSKTIRGASIGYDTTAAREARSARSAALTTLCPHALTILAGAGLVTAAVQ